MSGCYSRECDGPRGLLRQRLYSCSLTQVDPFFCTQENITEVHRTIWTTHTPTQIALLQIMELEPERKTRFAKVVQFPLAGVTEIPRGDRLSVLLLFIFQFGSAGGYVTARTVADSHFLAEIGPSKLPAMYMVSAGAVALVSILYGWFAQRHSLRRIVRRTLVVYAAISLVLPTLMHRSPGSLFVFSSVYVFAQIRGALGTVHFTTLLNETFTRERPASIFGVAGMGATLAGISLGTLVGWLGCRVATENLLYISAAMDIVAFTPILFLRGRHEVRAQEQAIVDEQGEDQESPSSATPVGRVPSLAWIAALAGLAVTVSTFVEFQWQASAAEELGRDEGRLTTYFGYFYAIVFLCIGVAQLVFTGRILSRLGVIPTLMALPFGLVAASLCTLSASAHRVVLWTVTLTKGCDVLRRSLNDPGMQMLYTPMRSHDRRRAIAVVLGIVKPSSEALTALALLIVVPVLGLRELSYVTVTLAIFWLGLLIQYQLSDRRSRKGC
jgi:ATP/ADP translocase